MSFSQVHLAAPKAGQKQRIGRGAWEQATNAQQRRLVAAFDKWAPKVRRRLSEMTQRGESVIRQVAHLDERLKELEATLVKLGQKGAAIATKVAAGADPSSGVLAVQQQLATDSETAVTDSLIPHIREAMIRELERGVAAEPKDLKTAFDGQRASMAQFAGGLWFGIMAITRAVGKERETDRAAAGEEPERVRWVLDPLAEHCAASPGFFGCPDLEGIYENWDALPTIPGGQTTCRGNDRCHLEVEIDGRWERGLA